MIPTADDIAIAIVAACRETGEDPVACVSKSYNIRARHYALWALVSFFHPETQDEKDQLARLVGAPGKPHQFWGNSAQVYRPGCRLRGRAWWDAAQFSRVVNTLRDALDARDAPVNEPPPYRPPPDAYAKELADEEKPAPPLGRMERDGYRPPADTIRKILEEDEPDSRPVMDRGGTFSGPKPREWPQPKKKVDLQEELRQAVANTAKMPLP